MVISNKLNTCYICLCIYSTFHTLSGSQEHLHKAAYGVLFTDKLAAFSKLWMEKSKGQNLHIKKDL